MFAPKSVTRWVLGLVAAASLLALGMVGRGLAAGPDRPRRTVRVEPTAMLQVPALDFTGATSWINTGPITAKELRGKVVLLDFWTFCCINCHHVLPDLARLEQKYRNELVVIGVHSPKFFAERDTENIRSKVHEYQIKHPVINDADQVLWNRFGVNSWPTLGVWDVDGTFAGGFAGEGHYAALDHLIGALVGKHQARGDLNETPLQFYPESDKPDDSPLSFPGKVLADAGGKRLFIADTAHNRIVQADLNGGKARAIGDGTAGLVDGDYARAQFHRPQGMCLVDDVLYVADTENHALRAVDLKSRKVSTVAGTGQQSHQRAVAGPGAKTGLNSPWDVILIPNTKTLAIAMAGIHEIWRYDIPTGSVRTWAGTGAENILDGPVHSALFAQPSGLASDGTNLYVADSEVSALRTIALDRRQPAVHTIVGSGLFVFGDQDGVGDEVRLQHCLGVAYGNDRLYIADTYNNKIKVCDPKARTVETLVGSKQPGKTDDPPHFYQPGGLSVAGTSLYVADTNNGAIRVVDLKEKTVRTLELEGLKPPAPRRRAPAFPKAEVADLEPQKVAPGSKLAIEVNVPLASGFKLNAEVPMPYLVETPGKDGILAEDSTGGQQVSPPAARFVAEVKLAHPLKPGDFFPLKLSVGSFVCNENSSLCLVKNYVWNIPITVATGAPARLSVGAVAKERGGDGR